MKLEEILSENSQKALVEAYIEEMANLYSGDTGLKYVIWIGKIGGQHGPRIKVSNIKGTFAENDNFVMSVSKDPVNLTPRYSKISTSDLEDIEDWIKKNYDVLMELYRAAEKNERTIEILNKLEKI